MAVAVIVCRDAVAQGLRWIFSDSMGAIVVMSVIGIVLAIRAKRHAAINPTRSQARGAAGSTFANPPVVMLLRLAVLVLVMVGVWIYLSSR